MAYAADAPRARVPSRNVFSDLPSQDELRRTNAARDRLRMFAFLLIGLLVAAIVAAVIFYREVEGANDRRDEAVRERTELVDGLERAGYDSIESRRAMIRERRAVIVGMLNDTTIPEGQRRARQAEAARQLRRPALAGWPAFDEAHPESVTWDQNRGVAQAALDREAAELQIVATAVRDARQVGTTPDVFGGN